MDTFVQIVLVVSFLIHSVLKNLVIGGIPILLMTHHRGRHGEARTYYESLAKGMSHAAPMIFGLAAAFGLVLWVSVWLQYGWTLSPVFGSVTLGWMALLALLLLGFWGVTRVSRSYPDVSGTQWTLGSLTFFCMIAITGLFVSSHTGMFAFPRSAGTLVAGQMHDVGGATFWPRFFHSIFSGIAITGMTLTIYGSLRPQCREDSQVDPAPYDTRLVRYGVGWVLGGTVPQVVVGPWFLLALPSDVRFHLVDGTSVVSLIFFVSLTLTLLSLVLLNSSLMIPQKRGLVWGGVGSLIVTMVFMVLIREEVRKIWMTVNGEPTFLGDLSWLVVISVMGIMGVGLYLGGRYVTLSHSRTMIS
ncbi:MAG: hypothetical protein NPIRA02_36200 [Nitrospirales bacterium]|nr:MAG: hypothetical protein NPIRA02_36200 [Nitrospirales bacterium]